MQLEIPPPYTINERSRAERTIQNPGGHKKNFSFECIMDWIRKNNNAIVMFCLATLYVFILITPNFNYVLVQYYRVACNEKFYFSNDPNLLKDNDCKMNTTNMKIIDNRRTYIASAVSGGFLNFIFHIVILKVIASSDYTQVANDCFMYDFPKMREIYLFIFFDIIMIIVSHFIGRVIIYYIDNSLRPTNTNIPTFNMINCLIGLMVTTIIALGIIAFMISYLKCWW